MEELQAEMGCATVPKEHLYGYSSRKWDRKFGGTRFKGSPNDVRSSW